MATLYLDPFAGISGDMFLGLLVDLGLDPERLRGGLALLGLEGWRLEVRREARRGLSGTRVEVCCEPHQPPRDWRAIDALLAASPLPGPAQAGARRMFRRLAEAEAGVHGCALEEVHFHEVGALDAIVDIAGAALGVHLLGIGRLICAPLPLGRGFVETAHGRLPLPAPASAALVVGFPICDEGGAGELVTPTGAAIATTLAEPGELPPMRLERVGYGVGARDPADRPNLLRGFLGAEGEAGGERDQVMVLESHLDDANPEWLGHLLERLLAEGALDCAFSPLQMKKGRPGVAITVIAPPERGERLARLVLRESSASGVRQRITQRLKLERRAGRVETRWGAVEVKLFYEAGRLLRATPEYEACRRVAAEHGVALPEVYRGVERAAAERYGEAGGGPGG